MVVATDNLDAQAGSDALLLHSSIPNVCTSNYKSAKITDCNCNSTSLAPQTATNFGNSDPSYFIAYKSILASATPCATTSATGWVVFKINYAPTIGTTPNFLPLNSGNITSFGNGVLFKLMSSWTYKVKIFSGTKTFNYALGGNTYPPSGAPDGFGCNVN